MQLLDPLQRLHLQNGLFSARALLILETGWTNWHAPRILTVPRTRNYRIRQDFGPNGPGANDMRAALEYLCTPLGTSQTNSEVAGSYKPPAVGSWSIGKIVSGKYVMIVDVIVDEQEGLDTVTMVSTAFAFSSENAAATLLGMGKIQIRMIAADNTQCAGRYRSDRRLH